MEQQLRGYRGDGRDAGVGIGGWDSIGRGSSSHKDPPKASQKPAVGSNPNPMMTVPTSPSPDPKSPSPPRPNEKDVTQLSPLPKSFGMRRNKHKPTVSWDYNTLPLHNEASTSAAPPSLRTDKKHRAQLIRSNNGWGMIWRFRGQWLQEESRTNVCSAALAWIAAGTDRGMQRASVGRETHGGRASDFGISPGEP